VLFFVKYAPVCCLILLSDFQMFSWGQRGKKRVGWRLIVEERWIIMKYIPILIFTLCLTLASCNGGGSNKSSGGTTSGGGTTTTSGGGTTTTSGGGTTTTSGGGTTTTSGGGTTTCSSNCSSQGACSSHGGVNCSAGADSDGSVICVDGWRDSSVTYQCH